MQKTFLYYKIHGIDYLMLSVFLVLIERKIVDFLTLKWQVETFYPIFYHSLLFTLL